MSLALLALPPLAVYGQTVRCRAAQPRPALPGVMSDEIRLDPVAGALEGVEYETATLLLEPGDTLLLYTDGVSEAMNPANELFGEERLLARLKSSAERGMDSALTICQDLDEAVFAFADGAEQSDDITLLALRYRGTQDDKA